VAGDCHHILTTYYRKANMKQHHFVVCATFDENGDPHFEITDSICDPTKPVWDTESEMWGRVSAGDEDDDFLLLTALKEALTEANLTKETS